MNIFKVIKKYFVEKDKDFDLSGFVAEPKDFAEKIQPKIDEIIINSDVIETISQDNFIDTTNPMTIAKYKSNLKLLTEKTKRDGCITRFKAIREDDFLPYNWEWRVASKNTGIEFNGSYLAYALREAIAHQNLGHDLTSPYWIPMPTQKVEEEMSKIDRKVGLVYAPVRFRSTKHFTVNTPLGYTGEYNLVETGRNFTIIDDIDNFLQSGYGYSLDYRDAYLDVTHESLKISDKAVVLIAKDKYDSIMSDPNMAKQLQERRVVVYHGDESVAINMLLSESGVLPARPGNLYMIYDDEIRNILDSSMQSLANQYGLEYAKGHGNINGSGGHFSDLYDGYNTEYANSNDELIEFLTQRFPNFADKISHYTLKSSEGAFDFIRLVGPQNLLAAIDEYNKQVQQRFYNDFNEYLEDRMTITPEISQIFKTTLLYIRQYYFNEQQNKGDIDTNYKIRELIRVFMHADKIDNQLLAAHELCKIFGVSFQNNSQDLKKINMK